ncbi:uncharacterized protein LOC107873789 [Capsicum annuum]|uniref:uncharacterized protein LOC107873789 n=1 Tax=Capsicum annuum TaxID=4072 RepID=UPI001FB15FA1|nr:uncharacterized protein LOC107873789 [Capsicum annuum]
MDEELREQVVEVKRAHWVFPGDYDDVHGGFGFGDKGDERAALLDFSKAFGLVVVNSSFPKKEDHLIIFRSAIAKTQIDFLLLRKEDRALFKDCKVISSEHLLTQHRLLVMDLTIKKGKKRRAEEGWPRIREKRVNRETYKVARKEAKFAVTVANTVAFESLYAWLDVKGGEKMLYWHAKARDRKGRDLKQVKCIKGEDGTILVEVVHIKRRWQEYFHRLLYEEGDRDIELEELEHLEERCDFSYYRHFWVEEVIETIRRMQKGRATGPDEILVDFWKFIRKVGLRWLTDLFNNIFKTARMAEA